MKLGHTNDEIKFAETIGTITRFVVLLDGIETMHLLCDAADPEKTIRIAAKFDADTLTSDTLALVTQTTKGHFTTYTKLLEDVDGMPLGTEERVDRKSVYGYILPRLHVMLGRLLRAA